ncbi:MAG: AAA family ATPase [Kiritimatiellae bacterium]|nr:AAA family ATPase [Kiritimatiellia bacterium]
MANSPMYYGGKGSSSPMYYGGKRPVYYGGAARTYDAAPYGGGAYGGMAYGGNKEGESDSFVGTITITRMLRVISQRWLSIFVFLLVGLIVSFAIYRISPTIYEATSEFSMDMRRSTGRAGQSSTISEAMPDYGATYVEIFNTRLSDWRSEKVLAKVVQQYRASRPASTVTDEEIIGVLAGSTLELVRNSRIIKIALRSKSPALCADLANAYAESIEAFTDEENKARCDKAVAQIHSNVERQRRSVDKIAKQMMDFRAANKVDSLRANLETVEQARSKTTTDILALEAEESQLIEWEKMLAAVQQDPASYGNLSTGVPRAQEIAAEFKTYQDAEGAYQKLMLAFTEEHPDVIAAKKMLDLARQRFLDSAARALQTGRSTLQVTRNQLAGMRQKREDLGAELADIAQRIGLAESGVKQLESDYEVQNRVLEGLYMNENQARIEAESNNEIVRVGRPAPVPERPVLPNPLIIFGAGVFLSLALGVLFVLVVDNLEDTVVNLADIEGRLSLKVLAVLPHVRRKKRAEVAKFMIEDKYSQFAESVAGLRNLLDSPRYEALCHCVLIISTQPGEGKTIASTSLAISYAQAGRKVLHVDFDLRRPRLANIWGFELSKERSFSHVLQNAGTTPPDFAALINHTEVPGLDIMASLAPDGVSPATIFGSSAVSEFFDWARANYDHVVVDSPPFGVVGDVVSLSVLVDSVIIMCCPDRTHFRPIQFCSRSLTEAGANILGAIVNDIEFSNASAFTPHAHGHGYHKYGYGYGYGYRPKDEDDRPDKNKTPVSSDGGSSRERTPNADAEKSVEDLAPRGFTDDE